jgi:serine/threonine-protein kinase
MPGIHAHPRDVDRPFGPALGASVGLHLQGLPTPRVSVSGVDLSGQVLGGRYRLLRPLGQGGMATIYEAEHTLIEKQLAVKVLGPEHARCRATADRFLNEAKAASRLRGEHVVDITDYGECALESGEPVAFFAMERLDGEDLAVTLEQDGPLRWTRVLQIAKQVCRALIVAHDAGVVHCDIKPANCFRVLRGDGSDFIKLIDFGVARFACPNTGKCAPESDPADADAGASCRRSRPRFGTPGYMAGELLAGGEHDHRVDIYALGVLMYRLLTNKMPYPAPRLYDSGPSASASSLPRPDGESSGGMPLPYPMRRAIPTLEIPAEFEALVLRAAAQDPDARFPHARALYEALVEVEQATVRSSPLARDPLRWGDGPEEQASASQTAVARAGSSNSELMRTSPDLDPSSSWKAWPRHAPRPAWPRIVVRATLALVATMAVVRVAWALSG